VYLSSVFFLEVPEGAGSRTCQRSGGSWTAPTSAPPNS